jgi:hypothetical protein
VKEVEEVEEVEDTIITIRTIMLEEGSFKIITIPEDAA